MAAGFPTVAYITAALDRMRGLVFSVRVGKNSGLGFSWGFIGVNVVIVINDSWLDNVWDLVY